MGIEDLGTVIAERELSLEGGGTVVVRLGKPEPLPNDREAYYCPYQIVGGLNTPVRFVVGTDAFQALEMVLYIIGVHLSVFPEFEQGKLTWEAGTKGDLGFPPLENLQADIRRKIAAREEERRAEKD